jgi:hypothetical protein
VKGRRYWYFDQPDGKGGRTRRYVGPADDPEIASRVVKFTEQKDGLRARRRLVSSLTREGGMIAQGNGIFGLSDGLRLPRGVPNIEPRIERIH